MAFNGINMTPLGGNSRAGESDLDRNAPMGWAYQSKTDNLPAVLGTGYFDSFHVYLVPGQFIYVNLIDQKAFLTIKSVDQILRQVVIDVDVIRSESIGRVKIIGVSDTSSLVTISILSADILIKDKTFIVKDESGEASTNNITVNGESGETIDGVLNVVIKANYGVLNLYSDGAKLFAV